MYLLLTRQDKKTEEDEEQEDESSYNTQETEAVKYDEESRRSEEAAEKTKENKKEADDAEERKQRREEDTDGPLSHPPDDNLTSRGTHVTTTITKEVQSSIWLGLEQKVFILYLLFRHLMSNIPLCPLLRNSFLSYPPCIAGSMFLMAPCLYTITILQHLGANESFGKQNCSNAFFSYCLVRHRAEPR